MCLPIGPRYDDYYRFRDKPATPRISSRIKKGEVDEIIASGDYECSYRKNDENDILPFEGGEQELMQILHKGTTKVRVEKRCRRYFREYYKTVVMNAPSINCDIILRTKLKEE